ncbi:hypothetical protein GW796_07070 [archaeon]|nr:hypothetical protein [archaeon]
MLLQELFKPENEKLLSAYSIVLDEKSSDTEYATPPENLEEIGFVFKVDEDGMMDEALMDVVISYRLTNLPVLIEVPSQLVTEGKVEVKYLLQLANNVDFSVALLPPGHALVENKLTIEQYKGVILSLVDEMLSKPNFDKYVYPISNFFEYLMLEQVVGKEKLVNFRPESKYVQESFSNLMSQKDSDDFKADIRSKLYDFYGSREDFELVAKTMLEGVYDKTKEIYKDIVVHTYIKNK